LIDTSLIEKIERFYRPLLQLFTHSLSKKEGINLKQRTGSSTRAIHAGERRDPQTGAITTPIYQTSNFAFSSTQKLLAYNRGESDAYIYTRYGNPTLKAVETKIAALEDGDDAAVFASGMAAITTAILPFVEQGDHIVASRDIYGGTFNFLNTILPRFGITTSFVDATDTRTIAKAIRSNTKLLFCESPTNPTLKLVDLAQLAELGREQELPIIFDNTFATPINQHPVRWGIEIIVHSATKYLGGHNDLMAGVIVGPTDYIQSVKELLKIFGGVLDPHAAWLLLRGLKTLPLRVHRHNHTSLHVAKYLEEHNQVKHVYYPGLESHPQHTLAKTQMQGYGGVISFELKGDSAAASRFVDNMTTAFITPSLGGVETLITQPSTTSHYHLDPQERKNAGISDELIRLSVGLEDVEDILAGLEHAFTAV
jgi:cystathionine beta-lyase/cystathionine gamma-synthase